MHNGKCYLINPYSLYDTKNNQYSLCIGGSKREMIITQLFNRNITHHERLKEYQINKFIIGSLLSENINIFEINKN
jgi:hypothetical protein